MANVEEAQAGLDFAKRFEIIKGAEAKNIRLAAVDLSDESAIAAALPRCAFTNSHCQRDSTVSHLLTRSLRPLVP